MKYVDLCEYYERLESTTKNLEIRDIVVELLVEASSEDIELITLASMGRVFPASVDRDLGIAGKMMQKIISRSYGINEREVVDRFKDTGDLGKTAEYFSRNRKQRSLAQKELTVNRVYENIRRLPGITGNGSQERKVNAVKELLVSAEPLEARYVVRTILDEMRIGVGEGTVRDAIAKAFDVSPDTVEKAFFKITDYGKVAKIAMEESEKGLKEVEIEVGKPLRTMQAEKADSLESAFESYDNVALEFKYDGFRAEIHKNGDDVRIFSRRLTDETDQFPEVVEWAKKAINVEECIIDCEIVAVDEEGKPLPFQKLSRRIQRKYDIEKLREEVPVHVNCFDLFYVDGEDIMGDKLKKRWERLERIVDPVDEKFNLVERVETDDLDEAREFYQRALDTGEEGLIVKNLDAKYQPGKRVGYWLKVKETMEPLDLVITEGIWGEGKRSEWISSLLLSVRDEESGKFLSTGKMATGLTEEQLEDITEKLEGIITEEEGRRVRVKPKVVVEVGYEEIQRSPKYQTGYALRFPRLRRFRPDKGPDEADTTKRLKKLYEKQK